MKIETLKVQELNAQELKKIQGGVHPAVIAFVVWAAGSAWDNIGDFRDGWNDGKKGKPRY